MFGFIKTVETMKECEECKEEIKNNTVLDFCEQCRYNAFFENVIDNE